MNDCGLGSIHLGIASVGKNKNKKKTTKEQKQHKK